MTSGNGLAYLLAAEPLTTFFGLSEDLLVPMGVFLLAYGVAVGTAAARIHPQANVAWAAASVAALLTGALSPTLISGLWIGEQAVVVGGFAAVQNWVLRRLLSMS